MKIKRKDLKILIENILNEDDSKENVFISYTVREGDNLEKIADMIPQSPMMYSEPFYEFISSEDKEKLQSSALSDAELHLKILGLPAEGKSSKEAVSDLLFNDIVKMNKLSDPNKLQIGQKLMIPVEGPLSSVDREANPNAFKSVPDKLGR